jgi:hypothetical protein
MSVSCTGAVTCSGGASRCDTCLGDPQCIDFQTDDFHCGACGEVCAFTQTCVSGSCEPIVCVAPEDAVCDFSRTCVDLDDNDLHCGGCFRACDTFGGEICSARTCIIP